MKTLVIAPHPDDEVLGCGGTLMRRRDEGAEVGWLIVTAMTASGGWTTEQMARRGREIDDVRLFLGVRPENLFQLGYPTRELDQVPMSDVVARFEEVFRGFAPEEVLTPFAGDAHSDHRITADAVAACSKWFRFPSVKRVLAYETLSETGFGRHNGRHFEPNVFIDISHWQDAKLEALSLYASEVGAFPFPRSPTAVRALAQLRGAASGYAAAEGFELIMERSD